MRDRFSPRPSRLILARAQKLYGDHTSAISRDLGAEAGIVSMRPGEVTPIRACKAYGRKFVQNSHPKSSLKKNNERINMLQRFFYGLADEPMSKYSARQITKYIKNGHFGKEAQTLASRFWQYCLDQGYCYGVNPFPEYADTRMSESVLQRKSLQATTLSAQTQDNLFRILIHNPTDLDCGVALMSSGFTCEHICTLRWKNTAFDTEIADYVRVGLYLPERAGAQHNYTRPSTPQCALVLRKRYEALSKKKDSAALADCYVVTGAKTKTISPGELSKVASEKLVQAGVDNDTLTYAKKESPSEAAARTLLKNTYQKNLVLRCGLTSEIDNGTFRFLCGMSLAGDTTSSNYVSFTSPEAQKRLYYLLRILQPEAQIPPRADEVHEDGSITYCISPITTGEHAGIIADVLLMPGEEISIECLHGVNGGVRTRPVAPTTPESSQLQ